MHGSETIGRVLMLMLLAAPSSSARAQRCTDDVNTIGSRIGEHVIFCGTPSGIKCAETGGDEPIWIDFGGPYPEQAFSMIISAKVCDLTCLQLRSRFEKHHMQAEGTVILRAGKPIMELKNTDEILVLDP